MREYRNILITLKNAVIAKKFVQNYKPLNIVTASKVLRLLYTDGFILSYVYDKNKKIFIIYLNYVRGMNLLLMVKLFNKKHSPKYITYKDLCTFINNCTGEIVYLSTSRYGLISHYKALKYKVGGKIMFLLR